MHEKLNATLFCFGRFEWHSSRWQSERASRRTSDRCAFKCCGHNGECEWIIHHLFYVWRHDSSQCCLVLGSLDSPSRRDPKGTIRKLKKNVFIFFFATTNELQRTGIRCRTRFPSANLPKRSSPFCGEWVHFERPFIRWRRLAQFVIRIQWRSATPKILLIYSKLFILSSRAIALFFFVISIYRCDCCCCCCCCYCWWNIREYVCCAKRKGTGPVRAKR